MIMIQPIDDQEVLNKILFQFAVDEMEANGVDASTLPNKDEVEAFLNKNAAISATEITFRWGEKSGQ
jgi:hypothetical protein